MTRARQDDQRVCYVIVGQAPQAIWQAYKRGRYPAYNPKRHANLIRGRRVRLGAMAIRPRYRFESSATWWRLRQATPVTRTRRSRLTGGAQISWPNSAW